MKTEKISINNFEHRGNNLYHKGGKYYRLYGKGITPNGCWIIAPEMRELADINIATGSDIYGPEVIRWADMGYTEGIGAVQAGVNYIRH